MEYYAVVLKGESLSHHGIKGMKWGVRRYQNPDGTLTEEGKRRYYDLGDGKFEKRSRIEIESYDRDLKYDKRMEDPNERQKGLDAWGKDASPDEDQAELGWALYRKVNDESYSNYDRIARNEEQKKLLDEYDRLAEQYSRYVDRCVRSGKSIYPLSYTDRFNKIGKKMVIQALKDMSMDVNEKNIESMRRLLFDD